MKFPAFDYASPDSLDEAVALLAAHGDDAMLLAGGQSLMPILAFRMAAPSLLVDLKRVPALDRIEIGADGVTLGARVQYRRAVYETREQAWGHDDAFVERDFRVSIGIGIGKP